MSATWYRVVVGAAWVGVLAAWSGAAHAQEGDEASSPVEASETPNVVILGFVDTSLNDCDPKVARYGRCVEDVRFMDMRPAWDPELEPNELQRAEWENTSRLYAQMWEDISYRFTIDSDPITEALRTKGVVRLPAAKQQWEASTRDPSDPDRSIYALPRSSSWLGVTSWVDPRAWMDPNSLQATDLLVPGDSFFPMVRFRKAAGLMASRPMILLRGRFAERMAADGKRHPYDIMDADPEASAPLFEQMYPYARAFSDEEGGGRFGEEERSQIPLDIFRVDDSLKKRPAHPDDLVQARANAFPTSLVDGDGMDAYTHMQVFAKDQFDRFYDLIGTQILRFAREEYTPTHIRVLTALMAIESPPASLTDGFVAVDDVVAASRGQMDTVDPSITGFRGFTSSRDGFAINSVALPEELVERHLADMDEWQHPSDEFLDLLFVALVEELRDHLRNDIINTYDANPERRSQKARHLDRTSMLPWVRSNMSQWRIRSTDTRTITAWVTQNSFEGHSPIVSRFFKRVALDLALSRLEPIKREELETRILLDHLNYDVKRTFGGPQAPAATPGAVEGRSTDAWLGVLGSHGMYPASMPDRQGVVNPLAICTLADRLDALDEPAFKRIMVDELVVAPAALATVDELLWSVREELPFIMLDDPKKNAPSITRLVSLPGDRAVYRIRWEVWAGWHLLWSVEPLGTSKTAPRRMALRTAAFCEDTVLSGPNLVPSLLRAAMLDGEFRPPVPVLDVGKTQKPRKKKSNDQLKVDVDNTIEDVGDDKAAVETALDAAKGDAEAIVETTRAVIGGLSYVPPSSKKLRGVNTEPVKAEAVLYVRDLFQRPLRELASKGPLLVMVFDHGQAGERQHIWDYKPRTPYAQAQTKFMVEDEAIPTRKDRLRWVRTAAWSTSILPPEAPNPSINVSPAYLPTELLGTKELKQQWTRRKTSEWHFGGGAGFMPYHYARYGCADTASDEIRRWGASVADCSAPALLGSNAGSYVATPIVAEREGIELDLFGLNSQWIIADQRIGIEFGPAVKLDIFPEGRSLFYDGDRNPYGITYLQDDDVTGATAGDDISKPTSYGLNLRFAGGIMAGVRLAPDPLHLWRSSSRRYPWGAPLPDGSSSLGRMQYGFLGGLMLGGTFDGLELLTSAEAWVAWSARSRLGPQASFTPYHPTIFVGPFIRGQVGVPLSRNPSRYYWLDYDASIVLGVRAQFRLAQQPEIKLEAPK
ncbi:MAG TPA: hypothetical protein PKA64_01820 [Myxococcota bacterium]|nr:hypothetical protein [Myxococcota bacterium]